MSVHDIGSIAIVLCAVLSITFVVAYHFSALWWKTEVGKHLMSIATSEATILITQSLRVITGIHSLWFELVRLIIFLSFPVVLTWRLVILWKLQIRPKRRLRREQGWSRTRPLSRQTRMNHKREPRQEGRRTPD